MSTYAWTITRDHLSDGTADWKSVSGSDVGVQGPRDAPAALLARLDAGDGHAFRMYDDDGELYYSGRIVYADPDEGVGMEPLDDFGAPNAGATDIHFRNSAGKWELI